MSLIDALVRLRDGASSPAASHEINALLDQLRALSVIDALGGVGDAWGVVSRLVEAESRREVDQVLQLRGVSHVALVSVTPEHDEASRVS